MYLFSASLAFMGWRRQQSRRRLRCAGRGQQETRLRSVQSRRGACANAQRILTATVTIRLLAIHW
jgi:hypothetical protein